MNTHTHTPKPLSPPQTPKPPSPHTHTYTHSQVNLFMTSFISLASLQTLLLSPLQFMLALTANSEHDLKKNFFLVLDNNQKCWLMATRIMWLQRRWSCLSSTMRVRCRRAVKSWLLVFSNSFSNKTGVWFWLCQQDENYLGKPQGLQWCQLPSEVQRMPWLTGEREHRTNMSLTVWLQHVKASQIWFSAS